MRSIRIACNSFLLIIVLSVITSCTVQQRKYQQGLYFSWNTNHQDPKKKDTLMNISSANKVVANKKPPLNIRTQQTDKLTNTEYESVAVAEKYIKFTPSHYSQNSFRLANKHEPINLKKPDYSNDFKLQLLLSFIALSMFGLSILFFGLALPTLGQIGLLLTLLIILYAASLLKPNFGPNDPKQKNNNGINRDAIPLIVSLTLITLAILAGIIVALLTSS